MQCSSLKAAMQCSNVWLKMHSNGSSSGLGFIGPESCKAQKALNCGAESEAAKLRTLSIRNRL
jgi:hypothetical protein